MKPEEIKKMSADDLAKTLRDLHEEIGKLSFQHRIRPLEDTSRLKKIRKDIARIETIKRQTVN
jgi:large subunit ribosomal protein L29